MSKSILNEIAPLSDYDCFYIIERYKTEFTYPLHRHKEYELNFIEGGEGITRVVGDSRESISDFELVLVGGENMVHGWLQGERVPAPTEGRHIREVTIQFAPDVFPPTLLSKTPFSAINRMLQRAVNGLKFPLSSIMKVYGKIDALSKIESRFSQVLQIFDILNILAEGESVELSSSSFSLQPRTTTDSRRVGRVEEYIQSHYSERITLTELAHIAGMSPIAFSRFFKMRAGRSVTDYIIDIRLGIASRMLVDTSKSVAEICYECGFNNISNFNRIFKKKRGITPKAFRENYRKTRIIC